MKISLISKKEKNKQLNKDKEKNDKKGKKMMKTEREEDRRNYKISRLLQLTVGSRQNKNHKRSKKVSEEKKVDCYTM